MKAILVDQFVKDFKELTPKQVAAPHPENDELGIKITHAALTHVDMLYAKGLHQNNRRHVTPPFILGNEFAGVVTTSSPTSPFQPGDRVFGGALGSYAEYIAISPSLVRKIPPQWSNAEACAVGASGAISYGALISVAKLQRGETILVLGATGGLGVMAVQIGKAVGARVICVVDLTGDGEGGKRRMLKGLGADVVVDGGEGWEDRVKKVTQCEEGVDVVYDCIGAVESGIRCLRYRGRLVVVGFAARGGKMEKVMVNRILLKGITVVGYRFGEDGRRDPKRTEEAWERFMGLVDSGKIKPVIYRERCRGLEELPRALEDLSARKVWGRGVLRINEGGEEEEKAKL